jgi:hypothetical protein
MFTWMNKQGVRSDRGFEFQFTGRFSAEYRADNRCITFDIESGLNCGKPCIIFYPNAFDHWDGGSAILDDERLEIIEHVREAVEFQGLEMVVE